MSPPVILVDGSSYFFRAFHALPPLTNSKGLPTGAIYGVVNMVKRLLKDYKPEQIAVVFDAKGKTFRNELYSEYKAHRPAMPLELYNQFQPLVKILEAMGLPILIIDGVEADDVIGTLAFEAILQGLAVLISTSDKDMVQLVNDHVTLVNTMSNQVLTVTKVKEKFGIAPHQFIDYLTLIGDSVDNIPGVTKCGPKTAAKWLQEYQTLEGLCSAANTISGKIGENLRACMAHLPLSKQLVTIKMDVPLPLTLADLRIKEPYHEDLLELIREFEFKNWLKELLEKEEVAQGSALRIKPPKVNLITKQAQLASLLEELKTSDFLCLAIETTSSDFIRAELVGISLATNEKNTFYVPLAHTDNSEQLSEVVVLSALKPILEATDIGKLGHNLKFCYNVLQRYGITLQGIMSDTMLESYVLNSSATKHDIESLSLKYLGHKPCHYGDIAGKGVKQLSFEQISVTSAAPYAAEKVYLSLKLHQVFSPLLDGYLKTVLTQIELPLLSVLAKMEYYGVLIDHDCLLKHGERLKERMISLDAEAIRIAGKPFNLNSPKQLQQILFEELKLPILAKTPTGQPSTAESTLQELAFEYTLPAIILEYRSLSKLVSTYIDALPKRIDSNTQRVHTCYNQAVAATGRLSSSEPNLQNIPIRSEEGRLIRKAFIAPDNKCLLAADYSQIELRIMAHLSHDEGLVQAFGKGSDIHAVTASEIFQIDLAAVTQEHRRRAKAVNFGLIYGMSAFGLAKQLGLDRQDAQHYMDRYFTRYPAVFAYMERTRQEAHEKGYVETLFGRRLYLPEINTRNITRRKAAERMAINAPMQGTAADIIKKAMLALDQWLQTEKSLNARMIMQVHDELVFEVDEKAQDIAKHTIRELMEHVVQLDVPLEVSIGLGKDWDEAH